LLNFIYSIHPIKLLFGVILSYFMVIAIFGFDFNLLYLIYVSTAVAPIIAARHSNQPFIDDPVSYITFDGTNMIMGSTTLPISAIKQVALDTVNNEGYFSLPLHHYSPGVIPGFIFPAIKKEVLKTHLQSNLSKRVIFIK
jgi:hypothetical protein